MLLLKNLVSHLSSLFNTDYPKYEVLCDSLLQTEQEQTDEVDANAETDAEEEEPSTQESQEQSEKDKSYKELSKLSPVTYTLQRKKIKL